MDETFDFGKAVGLLKQGSKVARKDWVKVG